MRGFPEALWGIAPEADMIQVPPQMRILVVVEPVDFPQGIDGLARGCQQTLQQRRWAG